MTEDSWTTERVVAHNMRRLRKEQGWTQEESAEAVSQHLDTAWTKATYANAEGYRPRAFAAHDLVAIANAFGVLVNELLTPPEDMDDDRLRHRLEMATLPSGDGWLTADYAANTAEAIRVLLQGLSKSQADHITVSTDSVAEEIASHLEHFATGRSNP